MDEKKEMYIQMANKKIVKEMYARFPLTWANIVHDSRAFFSVLFEQIMITEISGFLSHFFLARLFNVNFVQIQFIYDKN